MRSTSSSSRAGLTAALGAVLTLAASLLLGPGLATADSGPGHGSAPQSSSPNRYELHVATWGNDAWPGTRGRPFRTLARAQQAVRASTAGMRRDIVVEIHGGTYRLPAPLQLTDAGGDSGQNGHRVIWESYRYGTRHQRQATISGGRDVSGWRLDDRAKNIWRADVGDLDTRQLYVDGRRATRAAIARADAPALTRTPTGYTTPSAVPTTWSHPEDIELIFTGAFTWAEPICGIDTIARAADVTTITMDEPCWHRAVAIFGGGGFPGVGLDPATIENSKSFLAQPGTFYLDRSAPGRHVLYYIPRPGEDLRHDDVVAPALESLVSGSGTDAAPLHDVTFRGLTFADATWLQPGTKEGFLHYIAGMYENGDGSILAVTLSPQAQSMPGNVNFRRADRIVMERNRFERLGAQALELVGNDGVVRGNVITDVSGGGILVGDDRPATAGAVSRGDVVDNNWIHHVGVQYQGGTGIFATRTTNLTVAHNQVNDMPYSGIVVGQGHEQKVRANGPQDQAAPRNTGARILRNHVFDYMKVLHDGGGVYTTFKQGTSWDDSALVEGNLIHDMQKPYWALYTDWGSSWMRIKDNVLYDFVWGSTGGCSFTALGAGIAHMQFTGNYWIDDGPTWMCGPVDDVTVSGNTRLPADDAGAVAACAADAGCADIVRQAGLEPPFRDLL